METHAPPLKPTSGKETPLGRVYYLLAIFLFLSLFTAGGIVFIRTQGMLRQKHSYDELILSAKGIAGRVSGFIDGKRIMAAGFSSDGIIKDGLTDYDPDDPEVYALIKDTNEHLRKNKLSLDPYLEDILILNLTGRVVFSTNEQLLGKDKSRKDYFLDISRYFKDSAMLKKLKENPKLITYVSDFYFSDDLKRPVLVVSNIVTGRATGLPLGVLVNRYQGDSLDRLLKIEKETLSETSKAYVVNKGGLLLTVPKFLPGGADEVILKKRIELSSLIKAQEGIAEIRGIYKDFRGEKVLGASMLMENNDWFILAEEDIKKVFLPLYRLTLQIIIIGLISLCAVIGVSFFIAHLERNISSKAKQLEESRQAMFQAGKMAAVGQLSSSIAHEINNPLTGVLNNAQLLKLMLSAGKDLDQAGLKKAADAIEDSALACAEVSHALLDFFRASGNVFYPVSLNKTIDKVAFIMESEITRKNISLEKQLEEDLPDVRGDAQLLQQVIFNLITNASYAIERKFRNQQGGQIRIATRYEKLKGAVEASISDNGIGIAREDMGKVFKPFFTTKPSGQGTGLGLSIIHDIIAKHSGRINAESNPGEGATFFISLPVFNKSAGVS